MTLGQPIAGTDKGPQILRDMGLHQALIKLGWRIHECGDLEFEAPRHNMRKADEVALGGKVNQCEAGTLCIYLYLSLLLTCAFSLFLC